MAWEALGRPCGKRLGPFLPELVQRLEEHGELQVDDEVRGLLQRISASTIDRLLAPFRRRSVRRPWTQSPATDSLLREVTVRTFGEWDGVEVGVMQADLVAHCGESTEGFYLTTLVAVDVATGWCELEPVWGKGKQRVGSAVHQVRSRLPFPLRELHTDNGGEFLNTLLVPWCRGEGIRMTRGRPYRKNDQAYAEQKNHTAVRRVVGYQRFTSHAAYQRLQHLYRLLRDYLNFFQPVQKLVAKARDGARVRKMYDEARTPYQRLLRITALTEREQQALRARQDGGQEDTASLTTVLTKQEQEALEARYRRLNPVRLRQQLDAALRALWESAALPAPSVTPVMRQAGVLR